MEEGIVVGGGCTLLRLAAKVDAIKATLANDEEKVSLFKVHSSNHMNEFLVITLFLRSL